MLLCLIRRTRTKKYMIRIWRKAFCSSVGWLGVVMRSWERCKEKNNDELKKRDLSCFHLV